MQVECAVRVAILVLAHGARVRNTWATCPSVGNNPAKAGLIPHNIPRSTECYAELAPLSRGYSPPKGRLPKCYAPVRRAPVRVLLPAPRTRLACVKHAASVRSEPGSNSRLKPVA